MHMTIMRAVGALEMDVDIEVTTDVANIDYEEGIMTLYGTETEGLLWYITLTQDVVDAIVREWASQCMIKPRA